jgi:Zn-finger domain-containing protein
MANDTKKVKWFNYLLAWVAYGGAFLTKLSNIGNVVRDSFSDIHVPKKEEFYN